jgi:signal peptidase II
MNRGRIVIILILIVLCLDQASKIYVKTHFRYNEEVLIAGLSWARLHFVENEGMAFGITFDWPYGKLLLSLFRILMVTGLGWYIYLLIKVDAPSGFIYSMCLITAGALGNILDSAFYGMIFTDSGIYHHEDVAQMVPFGTGYGKFLHGKVVDMFFFPIRWIDIPEWVPIAGGQQFLFFSPIFNVADAAISIGVFSILVSQRRFFREASESHKATPVEQVPEENTKETEEDSTVNEA